MFPDRVLASYAFTRTAAASYSYVLVLAWPQTIPVPGQYRSFRLGVQDALNVTFVPLANERDQVVVAASYTASAVGAPSGRSRWPFPGERAAAQSLSLESVPTDSNERDWAAAYSGWVL